MTTKTKYRELIIARTSACNCGCSGSDPWHKHYYKRIVNVITDITGTVRLPMSSQPVRVFREVLIEGERGPIYGAWTVDRESIVFDRY